MKTNMLTFWKPTCELRLLNGVTLQQKWKSEHGHSEWRSIKIVMESHSVTNEEILFLIENKSFLLLLDNDCPILINTQYSLIDDRLKRSSGMITLSENIHAIVCRDAPNYVTDISGVTLYILVDHVPYIKLNHTNTEIIITKDVTNWAFSTVDQYNLLPSDIKSILDYSISCLYKKIKNKVAFYSGV